MSLIKPKAPRKNDGNGLIRYPVPIGSRTAYIELPRNLTLRDVVRINKVMMSLVFGEPIDTKAKRILLP